MKFETQHYAVIAGLLIAIGTQIAGLQHGWNEAGAPAFVGGLILQIGTTLTAMFVGPPKKGE